ncbi:MAG: hypothetical protein AB202_00065 [Parcubacteria bacterium C7867-007]|nr:MAG: hypothetical protein AB202_00065 [Parcubacteria bacterium C7867-007]
MPEWLNFLKSIIFWEWVIFVLIVIAFGVTLLRRLKKKGPARRLKGGNTNQSQPKVVVVTPTTMAVKPAKSPASKTGMGPPLRTALLILAILAIGVVGWFLFQLLFVDQTPTHSAPRTPPQEQAQAEPEEEVQEVPAPPGPPVCNEQPVVPIRVRGEEPFWFRFPEYCGMKKPENTPFILHCEDAETGERSIWTTQKRCTAVGFQRGSAEEQDPMLVNIAVITVP